MAALQSDVTVAVDSPAACGVLTWEGVCVSVVDKKGHKRQIVQDATGIARPGQLLMIAGPSGCGKSTLLDAMAGRLSRNAQLVGSLKVNGYPATLAYGRSAYVTQDEVLIGTLTVRETITYAARLRLRGSFEEQSAVAERVIDELGLVESADTLIGTWAIRGISGGQKRRVAVGCELVVQPTLIFLGTPVASINASPLDNGFGAMALQMSPPQVWTPPPRTMSRRFSGACAASAGAALPAAPWLQSSTSLLQRSSSCLTPWCCLRRAERCFSGR